jgi:hypothetical protein
MPPPYPPSDPESERLAGKRGSARLWKRWGTYLPERQWGTVREDYSPNNATWEHFPHEHARSRAYRWGEDGLLGWTDRECRLALAPALWNGRDGYLKERLFGLTGPQGNHGEDVKEAYFYLRGTPTSSYMKALYKYPQNAFPYERLADINPPWDKHRREYELTDTGIFEGNEYFEVQIEYAKAAPEDILIRYTITNRAPHAATLHLLPQAWFRNVWSWGADHVAGSARPKVRQEHAHRLLFNRETLGSYRLDFDPEDLRARGFLFTENETNFQRCFQIPNPRPHLKDAFHDYVVHGAGSSLRETPGGSKAAMHYVLPLEAGETTVVRLRMADIRLPDHPPFADFDRIFADRAAECEAYYREILPAGLDAEAREICLQAYAGLLWSRQFYHYRVAKWLPGDSSPTLPPLVSGNRANQDWGHLFARDIISMPDKWEYPWFAAWDLAFHAVPLARVDAAFAKKQLVLLLREWYMHPNGQIPAYEFNFSDVNPPVHAWAAWRVYEADAACTGVKDREFLAGVFQKLLLNFTWWVNRKDEYGHGIFAGGFLGLDNIGVIDRNMRLPDGSHLQQADGTAWMAFFCSCMLRIALELAHDGQRVCTPYEDMASKFLAHFVQIIAAANEHGGQGLWDPTDKFYYDHIRRGKESIALKSRSLVGLIPLIAVEVLDDAQIDLLPNFKERFEHYRKHHEHIKRHLIPGVPGGGEGKWLLALASREQLISVLRRLFDEEEFLSAYGIRSLSRHHLKHPFVLRMNGDTYSIAYDPGESTTSMFGGNSNWRGPVWFPVNTLIIEALERYDRFFEGSLPLEYPTHSGKEYTLTEIAADLRHRHTLIFRRDANRNRPWHGTETRFATDSAWSDHLLFHEFFHGDSGAGLGASHQTGWTALVATMLEELAEGKTRAATATPNARPKVISAARGSLLSWLRPQSKTG